MSQNYLRACTVTIDGLGTYTADGIRVRFTIQQGTVGMPNVATIKLTNSNRSNAEQFCKNQQSIGKAVTISAGYQGNEGVIFKGHIAWTIYGRENPTDTLLQILCQDGEQAHSYATVNKTLPPGSTPQDHVNVAMQSMQQYGVNLGFIGKMVDLSQPKYPRAVSLFGMARKVFDEVAKLKGATWGVQNLMLNMLSPGDQGQGGAFVLNSQTGLIGMPTLCPDGIYARTLINPQMHVDGNVQIDQSLIQGYLPTLGVGGIPLPGQVPAGSDPGTVASIAADGMYRIVKIDTEADTRGQPWYMDLVVINPGVITNVTKNYATSR